MSARRKNTRTTPHPGTGTTATAPAAGVPVLGGVNETNLWTALVTHPGSTTTELADHAGVSGSTARRILCGWLAAGAAHGDRDPAKPRAAVHWTPATGTVAADPSDTTESDTAAHPEGENPTSAADLADTVPDLDPLPDSDDTTGTDQPAPTDPGPQTAAKPVAAAPGDADTDAPAAPAAPTDADATDATDDVDQPVSTPLAPGALRGMVEDFLIEHPDGEYTPHQIGKALGRSSGAVHNALVKLATLGAARRTSDHPKRFALAATS